VDAADLGALLVGDRRNGDGADLRGECAHPEPDQEHGYEDDLRSGLGVERAEQDDGACERPV
jgi:hypothetical protein